MSNCDNLFLNIHKRWCWAQGWGQKHKGKPKPKTWACSTPRTHTYLLIRQLEWCHHDIRRSRSRETSTFISFRADVSLFVRAVTSVWALRCLCLWLGVYAICLHPRWCWWISVNVLLLRDSHLLIASAVSLGEQTTWLQRALVLLQLSSVYCSDGFRCFVVISHKNTFSF